jgi:hypothetical protein
LAPENLILLSLLSQFVPLGDCRRWLLDQLLARWNSDLLV